MIGSQLRNERQCETTVSRFLMFKCYCMQYTTMQLLLRRATNVVLVVVVRTAIILPVPQVHSNKAQMQ